MCQHYVQILVKIVCLDFTDILRTVYWDQPANYDLCRYLYHIRQLILEKKLIGRKREFLNIQGDSGEKENISRSDSLPHYKQKKSAHELNGYT